MTPDFTSWPELEGPSFKLVSLDNPASGTNVSSSNQALESLESQPGCVTWTMAACHCLKWLILSQQNLFRKMMPEPRLQNLEGQPAEPPPHWPVNHLFPYQVESRCCPLFPASSRAL